MYVFHPFFDEFLDKVEKVGGAGKPLSDEDGAGKLGG